MPYTIYTYQDPQKPRGKYCFSVVNDETKYIHATCSTLEKAKKQKRLLERIENTPKTNPPLEGEGIVDTIKKVADTLTFKKREAGKLPPKSRQLLEAIRDEPITKLVVVRTPIESYINKTLQFISGGQWEDAIKQSGYDKLFHLSLYINDTYVFHKIETTTLEKSNPIKKDSETREIPLMGKSITIGTLIQKTREKMGDQRFTNYDPSSENCQDFIMEVLDANGLNNPELSKFIKHDANSLYEKTPKWTAKISKFITDLGARANRLFQGEGIHEKQKFIKSIIKQMPKHTRKGGFLPMLLPLLAGTLLSGNGIKEEIDEKKYTPPSMDIPPLETPKKSKKTKPVDIPKSTPANIPLPSKKKRWIDALREWNGNKGGAWCIPKKGTAEYDQVKSLMG